MKHLRRWFASVALAVFTAGASAHQILFSRTAGLGRWLAYYPLQTLSNTVEILLSVLGVTLAHGRRAQPLRELGLAAPVGRAVLFALVATIPMSVGFGIVSPPSAKLTFGAVAVSCLIAPFAEEVLFRGYIFRQLYRRARWPYWPSVLVPSVLFALLHVYQATTAPELLGILAVTGIGSALLCWVFVRWQDNLWAPFSIHALMNLWWEVFAVDDTALGGWYANGARLATIALGIALTIGKDRLWPRLAVEDANVARVAADPEDRPGGPARARIQEASAA